MASLSAVAVSSALATIRLLAEAPVVSASSMPFRAWFTRATMPRPRVDGVDDLFEGLAAGEIDGGRGAAAVGQRE